MLGFPRSSRAGYALDGTGNRIFVGLIRLTVVGFTLSTPAVVVVPVPVTCVTALAIAPQGVATAPM